MEFSNIETIIVFSGLILTMLGLEHTIRKDKKIWLANLLVIGSVVTLVAFIWEIIIFLITFF
jgi:hypothetical protein